MHYYDVQEHKPINWNRTSVGCLLVATLHLLACTIQATCQPAKGRPTCPTDRADQETPTIKVSVAGVFNLNYFCFVLWK
jgi:hypothetical protein